MSDFSLENFEFSRVLHDDPSSRSVNLLGTLPADSRGSRLPAVVRLAKTPFDVSGGAPGIVSSFDNLKVINDTDIYTTLLGCKSSGDPDVKIDVIFPATAAHITKYSTQKVLLVRETPAVYESVVVPFIESLPPSRTQWVQDILSGKKEAEKVLYNEETFIICPDSKWDGTTISTLYLLAITRLPLRSMRDLRQEHLPMLGNIKRRAVDAAKEKWGLLEGALRFFVHYQPSYYIFHVHIVDANYVGTMGSTVGQAHLLDDLISMIELNDTVMRDMTFTYALGTQHPLYALIQES